MDSKVTLEQAVLDALGRYTMRSGAQLSEMMGTTAGKLYPALMALERQGKIVSEWEDMPPPRRRRYKLMACGPSQSKIGSIRNKVT